MNAIAQFMNQSINESIKTSKQREKLFNDYVKTNHYKEVKYWLDFGKEDDKYRTFIAYYNPKFKQDLIQFNAWGDLVSIDNVVRPVTSNLATRNRIRFRYRRSEKYNDYFEEVYSL